MTESLPKPSRIWWYLAVGFVVFWAVCLFFFAEPAKTARQLRHEHAGKLRLVAG